MTQDHQTDRMTEEFFVSREDLTEDEGEEDEGEGNSTARALRGSAQHGSHNSRSGGAAGARRSVDSERSSGRRRRQQAVIAAPHNDEDRVRGRGFPGCWSWSRLLWDVNMVSGMPASCPPTDSSLVYLLGGGCVPCLCFMQFLLA